MAHPEILYGAIALLSCGCAFWFGGLGERYTALLLLAHSLPGWPIATLLGPAYQPSSIALMMVDVFVLVAFLPILIRSERYWPIWVGAFQLAAITVHFAPTLPYGLSQQPPGLWAREFWQCPMWLALLPEALRHRRRPTFSQPGPASRLWAGGLRRLRIRWPFFRSI